MGRSRPLSAFSAALLSLSTARAEEPSDIHVDAQCLPPGASIAEVLRILSAELAPLRVSSETESELAIVLTIDQCSDEPPTARAVIKTQAIRSERIIDLSDAAFDARDRILALALAEAVRGAEQLPATTAPKEEPPAATAPPEEPAPAAPVSPRNARRPQTRPAPSNAPDSRALATQSPLAADEAPQSEVKTPSTSIVASAVFRVVVAPTTPLVGLEAAFHWKRVSVGVLALGTQRSTPLGTARLFAVAATVSLDVVRFGQGAAARAQGELGIAAASGSAEPAAEGHTAIAPHASIAVGPWMTWPAGAAWALEGFAGGGYASSLIARVDGRDELSLSGWFLTASLGVRTKN